MRATLASLLFLLAVLAGTAPAAEAPAWLIQAEAMARRDGYTLIDRPGVLALLATGGNVRILDVRPPYEFVEGHLPGAQSLEFDLGDERQLSPQKRERLENILGADKGVPVVVYCRGFR